MRSDRAAVADALVRIVTHDGTASGVAVATRTGVRVVTCAHVVDGCAEMGIVFRAETEDGYIFSTEIPAAVERVNKKWDLALLLPAEGVPLLVSPLKLAKVEPELYETVIIGACPNDLFGVVLDGLLQAKNGSAGDDKELLFSGLSVSGSSGGALANMDQELVGIITGTERDEEQHVHPLGRAAPLRALRRLVAAKSKRLTAET